MALVQEKKGGPYSKQEQQKRQNEVYRLHFEFGYPAVKIAKKLHVNRNTINSDINYLYSQLAEEWENQDISGLILSQIEKMKYQRDRLYEELEKQEDFTKKLSIEKFIFEIDNRLFQIYSKFKTNEESFSSLTNDSTNSTNTKEDRIQELVSYLIKKGKSDPKLCCYTEDEITEETVRLFKCDVPDAEILFYEMNDFGLCYYEQGDDENTKYNVLEFSKMRGY